MLYTYNMIFILFYVWACVEVNGQPQALVLTFLPWCEVGSIISSWCLSLSLLPQGFYGISCLWLTSCVGTLGYKFTTLLLDLHRFWRVKFESLRFHDKYFHLLIQLHSPRICSCVFYSKLQFSTCFTWLGSCQYVSMELFTVFLYSLENVCMLSGVVMTPVIWALVWTRQENYDESGPAWATQWVQGHTGTSALNLSRSRRSTAPSLGTS